jgi:hypothetical protein
MASVINVAALAVLALGVVFAVGYVVFLRIVEKSINEFNSEID